MTKRWVACVAVVGAVIGVFANGCSSALTSSTYNPCPDPSAPLVCPDHVCCPEGYPYQCGGKCYTSPAPCGSSYYTCAAASGGGGTSSGGNQTANGGSCPSGTVQCGSSHCAPIGDVCCASAGHEELSCKAGQTCNANGTCSGTPSSSSGGTSSGGTSSGGTSSGGTGVPCSQNVHPAWQQGECQPVATCQCKLQACVRVANGGCCSGYDLGWIFIPCDGSGGTSCGNCQNAATSALQQCGCTK